MNTDKIKRFARICGYEEHKEECALVLEQLRLTVIDDPDMNLSLNIIFEERPRVMQCR